MKEVQLSRRSVIAGTACFMAAGTATAAKRHLDSPQLALADITVGRQLAADYAGTLRTVAAMGYRIFGFRLASYNPTDTSEQSPEDKARMVRDAGMSVGVVRLGVRGGNYDLQLEQANKVGAKIVALTVAPVFIGRRGLGIATRAEFDAYVPELAKLAERVQAAGLILAYHNHWFDLTLLDGERPLDILARQISPKLLSFEVDLAWAHYGGVDPVELLAKLGPRVASMHWKDIDRARGKNITDHAVAVGSGEMDYAALLPHIRQLTSAVGYVEVDTPDDGLQAAKSAASFINHALSASTNGNSR